LRLYSLRRGLFQMNRDEIIERKMLVLLDFYMDFAFGGGGSVKRGCPFSLVEEFANSDCDGLCGFFFSRCRVGDRCPCHAYARPMAELHNLLKKEGYVDV
jgi:hypothetical protein